jgi:hypothetical protein
VTCGPISNIRSRPIKVTLRFLEESTIRCNETS